MSELLMSTENILENLNFKALNPMQIDVLESTKSNPEIILLSNTGSGKTLAFLIPLIQSIDISLTDPQALIMVPSRELAIQIESVLKQIRPGCKITCCYGGHKREIEENNLIQPPAIIIATAGRMADHLRRGNINPTKIKFLVLDEFDKILELDFQTEMEFIISKLTAVEKKILTSATQAIELPAYIKINDAYTINHATEEKLDAETLRIHSVFSVDNDKIDALFILLCAFKDTTTIVFCNHRDAVERTHQLLADKGILTVFYHGGMEQIDRENALCKFRNGTSNVLITTDLASRGLDIENIRSVVHYHLPHTEDAFTHRNGRTARMEATGNVYVIIGPEEETPAFINEKALKMELPERYEIPEKPKWSTLFIAAGKKDKINKIDIVGFLTQKGNLKKDDIGLIEVKDFCAFAAVRKSKIGMAIEAVKDEKMKNKKVKIAIAK